MPKQRQWFRSAFAKDTSLYVELFLTNYADGMPKVEPTLLATVYRDGQRYDAVVESPDGGVMLPGYPYEGAAYSAVYEYLQEHENRAELLCSQGAKQ